MQVKSSVGLAVGPVNALHWGQVLVMPNAYGIIEIRDELGQAQQKGIQSLSLLGQKLARGVTSLKALEDIADGAAASFVQSLVLFVPVGSVVYVVLRGEAGVYIKRGKELASLMHQDGGISGEIKNGDTFLLASAGFSRVLSHEELTMLFDHLTPAEVAEKLTLLLHEKTGGEGSVAMVFGATLIEEEPFARDTEPKEAVPVVPVPRRGLSLQGIRDVPGKIKHIAQVIRRRPRNVKALIAVLLIIFFSLSVVLGILKQKAVKKNQAMTAAMTDAQHALDEGVALLSLNPVKGRERLSAAKKELEPFIQTVSPRTTDGYALNQLYRKISDNLTAAMHSVEAPLALFYDMSLVKKGASASYMSIEGDTMAIGDSATKTVYTLAVSSKNAQVVGGGDAVDGVGSVAIHGTSVYVLTPKGITALRISDSKVSHPVEKSDSWGMVSSLVSFGGNLYLLDTQKSRIWKYVSTDTGFTDIREYLNPDTLPDFSTATSLAIDGSVWVGTTRGKILRFTQGKENPYVPQGVDPPLGNNLSVYTTDDAKNVYVLDADQSRVVVLDKDGVYLAQYRYTGGRPRGIVVSEQNKKILLLSDGKIYSVDLQ